jgi:hypothetical protein
MAKLACIVKIASTSVNRDAARRWESSPVFAVGMLAVYHHWNLA